MATPKPKTRGQKLSFRERLSRLTYHQARGLLGEQGQKLLRRSGLHANIEAERDVYLGGDLFRVRVPDGELPDGVAIVVLTQMSGKTGALHLRCDHCEGTQGSAQADPPATARGRR